MKGAPTVMISLSVHALARLAEVEEDDLRTLGGLVRDDEQMQRLRAATRRAVRRMERANVEGERR